MEHRIFYGLVIFACIMFVILSFCLSVPLMQNNFFMASTEPFITHKQDKIDVNKAVSAELETLPGIGKQLASNIINYRNESGRFTYTEELLQVDGITQELFIRIEPYIFINS